MSNVPKSKQKPAAMEFYHVGIRLKKELSLLLLRDFGVKARTWDVELLENRLKMEPQDTEEFTRLCEHYGIDSTLRLRYPQWFLDRKRDHIMQLLDDMMDCIVEANGIYPVILSEYEERRKLKKYRALVDQGRVPLMDAVNAYFSWRGNAVKYDSFRTLANMDELFMSPFGEQIEKEKITWRRSRSTKLITTQIM